MPAKRHGQYKTRIYFIWTSMIQRCHNPNIRNYQDYGGRGITVCERWRTSFEAFRDDIGPRPSPQHSIDRIDNDGNYEPSNVRWATRKEQRANRRGEKTITFHGESLTASGWARKFGLNRCEVARRFREGWPLEKALCGRIRKHRKHQRN